MPETPALAFFLRVRAAPSEWPHDAIVAHLLESDPLGLASLASRALVRAGVLLPTELGRRRVADRIALAVVRDAALPADVAAWLDEVALDAADSLRLDGLAELADADRSRFLARLASCLGVHEHLGHAALEVLHARSPRHVEAVRALLPANWAEVRVVGVDLAPDSALAVATLREVVQVLFPRS